MVGVTDSMSDPQLKTQSLKSYGIMITFYIMKSQTIQNQSLVPACQINQWLEFGKPSWSMYNKTKKNVFISELDKTNGTIGQLAIQASFPSLSTTCILYGAPNSSIN